MINIIIADDHPIVREGLKRIIQDCDDMVLAGEAASGQEALRLCEEHRTGIILLDISMPGPGILSLIKRIKSRYEEINILVLSVYPDQHYALRTIRAGASGYLNKQNSTEELATAIRMISRAQKYITPALAGELVDNLSADEQDRMPHEKLSNREFEVLYGLASGKTVGQVAEDLSVSPKTVSTYRNRLLKKLALASTADIISYAMRNGLIDQPLNE